MVVYGLEKILLSEHVYGTLCYQVKYKGCSVEQSKWLPAENLVYMQDMVCEFQALHPSQPKLVGQQTRSCLSAGRQHASATMIYMIAA